jgi:hypothetical protein
MLMTNSQTAVAAAICAATGPGDRIVPRHGVG